MFGLAKLAGSTLANNNGLRKQANAITPPKVLFPKLEGVNKPPVLTTPSQPALKTNPNGLANLPKMRVNGSKPKFDSEMKSNNPYEMK